MMAFHAYFVLQVLSGRNAGWDPQTREGRLIEWREAGYRTLFATLTAVVWGVLTYSITPQRRQMVNFAGPYYLAQQDILVAADDTETDNVRDLEGATLCQGTGSNSANRIVEERGVGAEGDQILPALGLLDVLGLLEDFVECPVLFQQLGRGLDALLHHVGLRHARGETKSLRSWLVEYSGCIVVLAVYLAVTASITAPAAAIRPAPN